MLTRHGFAFVYEVAEGQDLLAPPSLRGEVRAGGLAGEGEALEEPAREALRAPRGLRPRSSEVAHVDAQPARGRARSAFEQEAKEVRRSRGFLVLCCREQEGHYLPDALYKKCYNFVWHTLHHYTKIHPMRVMTIINPCFFMRG